MRKFKKHKVYSSFKDNILRVDLADMQLISGHNNGIPFLLCVSDPFSKYPWAVSFTVKKKFYNYWCFSKYFRWV